MHTNRQIITFVITICFICALILSLMATLLKTPQQNARELYKSKQLLQSAGIQLKTDREILTYYDENVKPMLVDDDGNIFTFEEKKINFKEYIEKNEKRGYARLPLKLIYVLPNSYIIPINGFGLWDAIYGYLAIKPDGDTVIGAVWYDQKETPGLGGEIATKQWLSQFPGKVIFKQNPDGTTDFETAPIGITVSKQPRGSSEVDAIAGATITCTGVSEAYRQSLAPYRQFLITLHK